MSEGDALDLFRMPSYGYFPGGRYDPRRFAPDRAVNTPDEMAEWRRRCAIWGDGVRVIGRSSFEMSDGVVRCGSSGLGMGIYDASFAR